MGGCQGIWGLIILSIALPIFNYTPCNLNSGCITNQNGKNRVESTYMWLLQLKNSFAMDISIIFLFLMFMWYNYTNLTNVKHVGALATIINLLINGILQWLIGIIITVSTNNPNFQWETLETKPIIFLLIGYSLLIFGNLLFNAIVNIFPKNEAVVMTKQYRESLIQNGDLLDQEDQEFYQNMEYNQLVISELKSFEN
ncbi:hypothetical protein PPERSA_11716 [Pseudocohnilembus persalinus]|uniref:Transmembrane protein n=1 Tax=Pseudocohnilembus persalinus TaxID=266149 RepID=A0A0V0QGR0_PSEPJ|nr:hypothetical protein PPERSA_11716 [Pseudocohnilembus persalinus]|eukprot:KRX01269.1 hypothetical protein PPERSA_11716 [Pseudocohnilembus persalinus]